MQDISDWVFVNHGEKSTLEKEELLSPGDMEYIMKYPREFDETRVNWEDINEVIAAKIGQLLGLKTVEAEIAYRNGKRGCLMLHFLHQYEVDLGEPGGPLLASEFGEEYNQLGYSELKSMELISKSFSLIERFTYYPIMKNEFVTMNVFDILIGNQDRHPYNWQLLFKEDKVFFGPLYDNGASLGWQLPDHELERMIVNDTKMNKFYKKMRVKAGIIEDKQPRLNANQVLHYCNAHYPDEIKIVENRLELFDVDAYNYYIDQFPLISDIRKEFLKQFIHFRLNKILKAIRKE
ncbi:HipA domain-containing protein [Virgibacillus ainsalahensis]